MKLEVEIPDSVLAKAVVDAWQESFRKAPYSNGTGGEAFERIKEAVHKYVATMDVTDAVKTASASIAPQIIRDEVASEIRRIAKKTVKEEVNAGDLFRAKAKEVAT